jgi:hypothetical protein
VVPVPERPIDWGLPVALSTMLREALWLPLAFGVKVTLTTQLEFAASELGQLLLWANWAAFVPLSATLVIASAAVPEFVIVTV